MKTKFSDFADYYIEKKIWPELRTTIIERKAENSFFRRLFNEKMFSKGSAFNYDHYLDAIWLYVKQDNLEGLKDFLAKNYGVLANILSNEFLGKLYSSTERNWFNIENSYFNELILLKNNAIKNPRTYKIEKLYQLNDEFEHIKNELFEYLNTLDIKLDDSVLAFLNSNLKNASNTYFVNFNYTATVKKYIDNLNGINNVTLNHIHGSLEDNNIIFGYGNDQNDDYQEIKKLEIDEFLSFFKTFDYMNDIQYDRIYTEAIESFADYEVLVIGHSLGSTDKTLLAEIFNSEKCKKIQFFKRLDLKSDLKLVKQEYRTMTYAASRILTDEKYLRNKVVNFKQSSFFP
jgi:hypothetical protein